MPTITPMEAFLRLYHVDEKQCYPWNLPRWKERTGVYHGLFPEDDAHLPKGWTRKDAKDVESFFIQYKDQATDTLRSKFVKGGKGSPASPGREFFQKWIRKNLDRWNIHSTVVDCLIERNVHPVSMMVSLNDLDAWPASDMHIPKVIDQIAYELFGPEAFINGVLIPALHVNLVVLVQRSWTRIRKGFSSDRDGFDNLEKEALEAFEELSSGKPSVAKIAKVMKTVSKWEQNAKVFGTEDNLEKANDMLSELHRILEAAGAKLQQKQATKPSKRTLTSFKKTSSSYLASGGDIIYLYKLYDQYFNSADDNEFTPCASGIEMGINLDDIDCADLGMEEESKMDLDKVIQELDLKNRLPYQFNSYRHSSGINPWDNPGAFSETSTSLSPFKLHWHQYAGVHSVLRNIFSSQPDPEACTGMLIADEVGLGKTALCLSVIAMVNQIIFLQDSSNPPPPVIRDRPILKDSDSIPSRPHVVIMPGTVRTQWLQEIKTVFLPNSFDIFLYESSKRGNADFWKSDSEFSTSKHSPQNRIILVSHSSLVNEYTSVFGPRDRSRDPWELPKLKIGASLKGTIFGQDFLSTTLDEGHEMRNVGNKYFAALALFKRALVRLITTATPLQTAPHDLSSLGRILGVPFFLSEESLIEEKEYTAAIRQAKKLDDDGYEIRRAQLQAVRSMHNAFSGHILRRTANSKDWRMQPLLDLPPCQIIVGIVDITTRESRIICNLAEAAKASVSHKTGFAMLITTKVYMEYRGAVGYAKDNSDQPYPMFNSLSEWEPVQSTKMTTTAKICRHYLQADDIEDVRFENGMAVFPETAMTGTATRKILIYAEFPSMTPLLQNVLQLYGVESLSIDGSMPFDKRDAVVAKFHKPDSARVFIFSKVGSAGLNLSVANMVIFFDQPWSAQDERQIIGRAHRQPQKSIVKVIHILANDTSDLIMNNMARQKKEMSDAFLNKEMGKDLNDILQGTYMQDDPDYYEEESVSRKRKAQGSAETSNGAKGNEDRPTKKGKADQSEAPKGHGKRKLESQQTQSTQFTSKSSSAAAGRKEVDNPQSTSTAVAAKGNIPVKDLTDKSRSTRGNASIVIGDSLKRKNHRPIPRPKSVVPSSDIDPISESAAPSSDMDTVPESEIPSSDADMGGRDVPTDEEDTSNIGDTNSHHAERIPHRGERRSLKPPTQAKGASNQGTKTLASSQHTDSASSDEDSASERPAKKFKGMAILGSPFRESQSQMPHASNKPTTSARATVNGRSSSQNKVSGSKSAPQRKPISASQVLPSSSTGPKQKSKPLIQKASTKETSSSASGSGGSSQYWGLTSLSSAPSSSTKSRSGGSISRRHASERS